MNIPKSTSDQKIFTIFGHPYTMRDPGAYGTDAIVQEVRKRYYLEQHPEDRDVIRSEFREHYAEWLDAIEDSATDNALLMVAVLIPMQGRNPQGKPDGTISPELTPDLLLAMPSWSVSDALAEAIGFFQSARLGAYRDYLASKDAGSISTSPSEPEATEQSPLTDQTTESTSPSNTKTE